MVAMTRAITSPVRFIQSGLMAVARASPLPRTCLAAGKQPIYQSAGDTGRCKHLARVCKHTVGSANVTGEVDTVSERQRQRPAEYAIEDDRTPGEAFGERDQQQ